MIEETIEVILKGEALGLAPQSVSGTVPREEFATKLFLWLDKQRDLHGNNVYFSKNGGEVDVQAEEFHYQFLRFPTDMRMTVGNSFSSICEGYPKPHIFAWLNDDWAVADVEGLDWLFAYREKDGGYIQASVPKGMTVEFDDGSLRGENVYYPAFRFPWPRPVWLGPKYEELGKLYYQLDQISAALGKVISAPPKGEPKRMPLQILYAAPQPYKGLTQQVLDQLQPLSERLYRLARGEEPVPQQRKD